MPLQRRTQTLQNPGPVTEGSSPGFEWSGTLLCGRNHKCYSKLYTDCSPVMMVASTMFEFNSHFKHSRAQSSFIHINWISLPMAAPWQGSKWNIGIHYLIMICLYYWRHPALCGPIQIPMRAACRLSDKVTGMKIRFTFEGASRAPSLRHLGALIRTCGPCG